MPVCGSTSDQKTAQWHFEFCFLHQIVGLAYRLLSALTMTESSEKNNFDPEKLIIEVEKDARYVIKILIDSL